MHPQNEYLLQAEAEKRPNLKVSVGREVACAYCHHTKFHILSHLLHYFSAPLLSFEQQVAHWPHCTHKAVAEHYHLSDKGQQKAKAVWVQWLRPVRLAQPSRQQTSDSLIKMGTNHLRNNSEGKRWQVVCYCPAACSRNKSEIQSSNGNYISGV